MSEITQTIYCADAIEKMRTLPENSVGLIVTSPPYNLGKDYGAISDEQEWESYLNWTRRWTKAAYEVLEPGGRLCLNVPLDVNVKWTDGQRGSTKLPFYFDVMNMIINATGVDWVYNTTILWLEGNVSRRTAWGSYCKATDPWINTAAEMILVLSKEQRRHERNDRTDDQDPEEFKDWVLGMWSFSGENPKRVAHPSPFPVELPRRLIKLFSFKEDLILDPFLGSGTTLVAAKVLGRSAIGIDTNETFCELAKARVALTRELIGVPA